MVGSELVQLVQREQLEELVHRSEAAWEEHVRGAILRLLADARVDERNLARGEELAEHGVIRFEVALRGGPHLRAGFALDADARDCLAGVHGTQTRRLHHPRPAAGPRRGPEQLRDHLPEFPGLDEVRVVRLESRAAVVDHAATDGLDELVAREQLALHGGGATANQRTRPSLVHVRVNPRPPLLGDLRTHGLDHRRAGQAPELAAPLQRRVAQHAVHEARAEQVARARGVLHRKALERLLLHAFGSAHRHAALIAQGHHRDVAPLRQLGQRRLDLGIRLD
mmetsp:Transcript_6074/g.25143  ORF Transcript_6074/g.25143 Transcript_6074/m.25143 type:complete len:281 (+) Transcript_6074:1705-2547(+)